MANIPSSSDIVNKEQQPLLTDEVQHEILPMPEMADDASASGTEASMVDRSGTEASMVDSSGTVHGRSLNIETQEERSLWREKAEQRLRIAKERLQCQRNGFQILKVPEFKRQPPEMFTPEGWRFGLHNLDSVDRDSGSEAMKLCIPLLFGLDEVEKWEKFSDYVVPDTARMLGCYGLHKEDIYLKEEEIKQLLAFDALCIAWKIDAWNGESGKKIVWTIEDVTLPKQEEDMLMSSFLMWSGAFNRDLWRVENQIPFELIKQAMEYIKRSNTPSFQFNSVQDRNNGNVELLEVWMMGVVRAIIIMFLADDIPAQEISNLRLSDSHHILDATYRVICGKKGLERKKGSARESFIHIPSAIQLKHVGVKIEGVAKPLCTMSYNKMTKSLILPKMKIYDETFAFIRNMARYEVDVKVTNNMFYDYISLIKDLIRTPEDMDHLIKSGVIDNGCGSRAFEKWELLNEGLTLVRSSKEHNAMKENIRRRYDQKLPKLWTKFRTLFCSRPWLIVPVIAATLVTIATLIQTYTAIIGSDRMMPYYKNP